MINTQKQPREDPRLYWNELYKRWTVDVLYPPERKTFKDKEKAKSFIENKKNRSNV